MKFKSHTAIGYFVLEILSQRYDLDVQEQSFLRGTILPDLLPTERKYIHNFDRMMDFLKQSLSQFNEENLTPHEFYTTLGMISHYLCDCFCLAHNLFHNNPIRHIRYELGINKAMKTFTPSSELIQQIHSDSITVGTDDEKICNYISKMHKQYLAKVNPIDRLNYDLDISSSMLACSVLTIGVLERIDSIDLKEIIIA